MTNKQRLGEIETNIPFGPIRTREVVVITPNRLNPTYVKAVVKVAPEYVLPLCTSKVDETGDNTFLGSEERRELLEEIIVRDMAKAEGLRTLVYAYKDMKKEDWEDLQAKQNNFVKEEDRIIIEKEMTFLAAFGLNDNLR